MKNINWKSIAASLILAAIFVLVSGAVSYLCANGQAVIGPHPESVGVERAAIAENTLWWAGSLGILAVLAFCVSMRRQAYRVYKERNSIPVFVTSFRFLALLYLILFCRKAKYKCIRHGTGTTPIYEST